MIISFTGEEGSGKSTVATLVSAKLVYKRYYMGQIFRDMAKEKNLDLPEFRKLCDNDPSFDKKLDDFIIELAEKEDNFVIESRTAWHFIPKSLKVFLKVDPTVAAKRIFKALSEEHNRENEDSMLNSEENIQKSILKRRKEDRKRYFDMYGIDQNDEKNYDFVLDTTNLSREEVFAKVMEFINKNIL